LFALFVLFKLLRERSAYDLFKFLIYPVLSSIILLVFSKAVYGTFNPAGIFPAENYWSTPFILKIKVFFAYFIDQRDGLLIYAPTLFLFFAGLRFRELYWRIPALLMAVYTVFHAVTTVRGAHAPAGRPLIFVFWIILLFMFNYYFRSGGKYLFRILTGMNMFILFWILKYPQFIYQPVFSSTSDGGSSFLKFMGSNTLDLTKLFPSFLTQRGGIFIPNILWLSALFIGILMFYSWKTGKFQLKPGTKKYVSAVLFTFSVLVISLFPHVLITAKDRFRREGISMFNTSSNFVWLEGENRFRIKSNEQYTIYFEERQWKKEISFMFDSPENSSILALNGKKLIFRSDDSGESGFNINLPAMKNFILKGNKLIPVWIRTESENKDKFFYLRIKGK